MLTDDAHSGAWLVDCGDVEPLLPLIGDTLLGVLLTHEHFDHIYGLNELLRHFPNVPIYTNERGREGLLSDRLNFSKYHDGSFVFEHPQNVRLVSDGQRIDLFDGVTARAWFTPGHSPACITWHVPLTQDSGALFTGDSYIPGIKTVTTVPRADKELAASNTLAIIRFASSAHADIYPGHQPNPM